MYRRGSEVVVFDSALTFNQHVTYVRACTYHTRALHISVRCSALIPRSRLPHPLLVQGWTIVIVC